MPASEAKALLLLLEQSDDPATLVAAATALAERRAAEAVPLLISRLQTDDLRVLKAVVRALGIMKDKRAIEPLFRVAEGPKSVRRHAMRAILELRDCDTLDQLLAHYETNRYRLTRGEALMLCEFADRRAVPLLVNSAEPYYGFSLEVLQQAFERVWSRGWNRPAVSLSTLLSAIDQDDAVEL